jgi:dCMP deaminase
MNSKWDKRFLDLAEHVSIWSKDPSTQVGCVIADDDRRVVALGINGFPKGIEDSHERLNDREIKYKYVVHSEPNAFANANGSVKGCTIYTYPFAPCAECMKLIITNGIKRVVYPAASQALRDRWGAKLDFAADMAREAGLELTEL